MGITNVFNNINNKLPSIFIIRHAERHYEDDPSKDFSCTLTGNGKKHAGILGKEFYKRIGKIYNTASSVVGRCVETGQMVTNGSKHNQSVIKTESLTKAYIFDPANAMVEYKDYSTKELVKMQLAGNLLPCMRDPVEGTKIILANVVNDISNHRTSLYITHDYSLAMFHGILTNICITKVEEEWFGYLDGICLQKNQNQWRLYRGSKVYDITYQLNKLLTI